MRLRTEGTGWHTVTDDEREEGRRMLAGLLDSLDERGNGYLTLVREVTDVVAVNGSIGAERIA